MINVFLLQNSCYNIFNAGDSTCVLLNYFPCLGEAHSPHVLTFVTFVCLPCLADHLTGKLVAYTVAVRGVYLRVGDNPTLLIVTLQGS